MQLKLFFRSLVFLILGLFFETHTTVRSASYELLGAKIDVIKKGVDLDVQLLKLEVKTLKTKIEKVAEQTNILLNSSSGLQPAVHGGAVPANVNHKLEEITNTLNILKSENEKLKEDNAVKNESLEALKAEIEMLKQQFQNLSEVSNSMEAKMGDFFTKIHTAFSSQKKHTTGALKKLTLEIKQIKPQSNVEIANYKTKSDELALKVDKVEDVLTGFTETVKNISNEVQGVRESVENQLENCCSAAEYDYPGIFAARSTKSTTKNPMSETVTMAPGGPRIRPIFGADLEKYIKPGLRVIRGADWAWGNQDGYGPGTVESWYGGNPVTKQVMVKWDQGTTVKANYRVGAYGKYDLFILA